MSIPKSIDPPPIGVYPGVPDVVYHSWDACSQSLLGYFIDGCAADAHETMTNPAEPTPDMILGQAVHAALLQPKYFAEHFIRRDWDNRSNAGKARTAEAEAERWELLLAEDYDAVLAIRDGALADPFIAELIRSATHTEASIVWNHPVGHVLCKSRLDLIDADGPTIWDLKTTRDPGPAFARSIATWGYHRQASFYLRAANEAGIPAKRFGIIALGKTPPYVKAMYLLGDRSVMAGEKELVEPLKKYAECLAADRWPDFAREGVLDVEVPNWCLSKWGI